MGVWSASPGFFDEDGVALNVRRILLAVLASILGPSSVGLLLLRIHAPKVTRMSRSPLSIGLAFALSPARLQAAGLLPFFDARVWHEQATTTRAPPPLRHNGSSPRLQILQEPSIKRDRSL
jgi:hypothetical protein